MSSFMYYFAGNWNMFIFPLKNYFVACCLNITEPGPSQTNVSRIQVSGKHHG